MSLQVSLLSKTYGSQQVLDQVSFTATPGRILGFLGPNGAGKSTTMKIITGYIQADSGEVKILSQDALSQPQKTSSLIGYLPEHNPLYLDMYVKEFLEFAAGLYGIKPSEARTRSQELIRKTGLGPEQHKKIGQLSKGYRQRVGLAKALIHDPKVVILDEPTTGLDPNQLVEIRKLIQEVAQDKTLILSTHIMQEVEAICQDVVIINQGKIRAADSLNALKTASSGTQLILESDEALELVWFEQLGKVAFGPKGNTELILLTQEPNEARRALLGILQEKHRNLIRLDQGNKSLETLFREITSTP
ncbi:gliding motility-associated ABC transporter ATP-binding subunit GldA [Algoriphagus sanaruensis]|uniref:Gliding motility-associated ABC transporterATP-binding subunit GldA n=1 Tax=Algoriphagus sanaruensis TaxID=1727163 RepID=A0A142EKY1_9BACT|nr:gliding motility-associated ABC transporter ATP-binding subunit GldA [Algoriphagus sanaruensis]AMQ55786.1 gliding motility-associated ABC transporterATP-binding subunit GldA [Algoriphagus sanaruensis]